MSWAQVSSSQSTAPITEPVADVAAATALLRAELAQGDVVLVKASRAAGLDRIAAELLGGNA